MAATTISHLFFGAVRAAFKFSLIQFAAHSKDLFEDKYTEADTWDTNRENDGYGLKSDPILDFTVIPGPVL